VNWEPGSELLKSRQIRAAKIRAEVLWEVLCTVPEFCEALGIKRKVTLGDVKAILESFMVHHVALDDDIEITTNERGQILLRITNTIANGEINVNTGTFNGKTPREWKDIK
jgi:hypothetical protein